MKSSPSSSGNKSLQCYKVEGVGTKGGKGEGVERLEKAPRKRGRLSKSSVGRAGKGIMAEGIACWSEAGLRQTS